MILGTGQFVDRIKARYASKKPHREVPQQRGLVGRISAEEVLEQASGFLHCDVHRFKKVGRLYGEDKENRDLLVFFLWERGAYTNAEIGEVFGVGYTAVSHIVKKVKDKMKSHRDYREKYALINSQIKM